MITNFLKKNIEKTCIFILFFPKKFKIASYIYIYVVFEILSRIMNLLK